MKKETLLKILNECDENKRIKVYYSVGTDPHLINSNYFDAYPIEFTCEEDVLVISGRYHTYYLPYQNILYIEK